MIHQLLLSLLLGGGVTVKLPMEAEVRGTEVELGEIAELFGTDPEEVKTISAVELGYAPAPGYSRLFKAEKIREILGRKAPGIDVRFIGQEVCRVRPEVEEISGAEIATIARLQLQRSLGPREASFEPVGTLQPVSVPAGAEEHRIEARLDSVPSTSGTISVPVEILVDGVRYRTVWTSWKVQIWETRPVLARHVRAGQTLRSDMFERRRVLLETQNGAKPLEHERLIGAVALRDLAPGEVVSGQDVNRPTVVTLGETLFLRVRKGPIEARVSAIALEAGAVGDSIRVQTTEAGQELLALVVSRDTCRIDLGE